MTDADRCERCGAELPAGTPADQCPACLLALGAEQSVAGDARAERETVAGSSPAAIPGRIGPYRLLEKLGEGGMGIVYLAEQREPIRRRVALKLIKPGMDTEQVLARFEAERQALATMSHPNVAKVFDAGVSEQGRPYFVMEHVPGIPITEYCDLRCFSIRERLELYNEVCEAIQHAHQMGIIHRDVKPSNVLVSAGEGQKPALKVIDFGVAKATNQRLTERTLFTQQGTLIGTPGYMSPEQAGTTGLAVDTRTDIYSLGVLLYELLVGASPFDPATLKRAAASEMLRIIREEEPPRPTAKLSSLGNATNEVARKRHTDIRSLVKQLQGELEWIVLRSMEKDRERRYASASELAADIGRHLHDEPVLAGPPSLGYRLKKLAVRHRTASFAAVTVLVALLLGLVTTTSMYTRARRAEARAVAERDRAEEQRVEAERQSYLANLAAAYSSLRSHEVVEAQRRLEACPPALRGWEWRHLRARTTGDSIRLEGHDERVRSVAVSPDGTRIASGSFDGTVRIWDPITHRTVQTLGEGKDWVTSVAFSPDGRQLVAGMSPPGGIPAGAGTLRLWDVESGRTRRTLTGHEGSVSSVAFSPDGSRIVSGSTSEGIPPGPRSHGVIRVWETESGRHLATLADHEDVRAVAFGPDGSLVASGSADATIRFRDSRTGQLLSTFTGHEGRVRCLAFSRDGSRLVSGSGDGTARVWELQGQRDPLVLRGHGDAVGDVAFSPDGSRIASAGYDKNIRVWDAINGKELAVLPGHEKSVTSVAWLPDGDRLVSGGYDHTVRIWDPGSAPVTKKLMGHAQPVMDVDFSPDGSLVASASFDGTARIWDPVSGASRAVLSGHPGWVTSVFFGPDGDRLVSTSRDQSSVSRRVWDVVSAAVIEQTEGPNDWIGQRSTVIRGGADLWLATTDKDGELQMRDLGTGEKLFTIAADSSLSSFAVSPDSLRLAAATPEGAIHLWEIPSGRRITTLEGHGTPVADLSFGPRGERLVSGSTDVRLWDVGSGRLLRTMVGHDGGVLAVAFSPDEMRIVSGGADATVRIWDTATGDLLLTLRDHQDDPGEAGPHWGMLVQGIAFSPDGTRLAAGSWDATLRIWSAPPADSVNR